MKSKKRTMKIMACLVILSMLLMALNLSIASASPAEAPKKPAAKNIIIMIADGRGFNHLTAASYYEYGRDDRQVYTRFPFSFAMSTYELYRPTDGNYALCNGRGYDPALAWGSWDWVMDCYTDSAAAATAMATGIKTYDGGLGVDISGNPVKNILELAEEKGKATGVITSVPFSHATPAGFVAHNVSRSNYKAIAHDMINSNAEVVMGGGDPWYDADGQPMATPDYYYLSQADYDALVAGTAGGANPWTLVQTRAEFQALTSGPTPARVFGLPHVAETLQEGRSGDVLADPFVVPMIDTVPTLVEMSQVALNVLDDDPDGLFLMIEGGAIDWAAHDNWSGRMIEEHIDFDRAVEAVIDWVQKNSNWGETLLIITNDHETGYLWGPGSDPAWTPIANNGAGNLPGMMWHSDEHTNSLVPLFVKGDAGREFRNHIVGYDPVRGNYIDNTDLAEVMFWAFDPK
jgi:alkaline phosphatase